MNKFYKFTIFALVNLSGALTLLFWFNNVDLSYLKSYFDLSGPLTNLHLLSVVRGHVALQIFSFIVFRFQPYGYYLVANVLHSILAVVVFGVLQKLFKNIKISFMLTILFAVNISYANVLFEGSFNAYYPLLLIFIFLSVSPFLMYVKKGLPQKLNLKLVIFPGLFMCAGLLFRETVLLIPLIISIAIFLSEKNYHGWKKGFIYLVIPVLVTLAYAALRSRFIGELKSDLTDDGVQARMAFTEGGRYFEWSLLSLANFLRMISEQVLPVARLFSQDLVYTVISGLAGLGLAVFVVTRIIRKNDLWISKIAIFGLFWLIFVNLFISLILPFPVSNITAKYNIGSTISRYNYWGELGLILIVGAALVTWKKVNRKLMILVSIYIAITLVLVQISAWQLYKTKHLPAKNFYKVVLEKYQSFPKDTYIYYNFFQVNNLRDYVGDLTYVFGELYYPGSKFHLETSLSYLEKEYLSGSVPLSSIYAFDMDRSGVFLDKTDEARRVISSIKNLSLESSLSPKLPGSVYANFGYNLEFWLRNKGALSKVSKLCDGKLNLNSDQRGELLKYFRKRQDYLKSVSVSTSSTYGDFPRFYFISPRNLADGQFGRESVWQANIGDNNQSIVVDLGEIKYVTGLAWYSEGQYALPAKYKIYTSTDKLNWQEAAQSQNINQEISKLERFAKPKDARYVKFQVLSTSFGQPVRLTEIEALDYSDYIFDNYQNWKDLIDDANNSFCYLQNEKPSNIQPGIVTWTTNKETVGELNVNFYTDKTWRKYTVPIVNLEVYSNSLMILDEKLKSIEIIPGRMSLDYEIKDVKLVPMKE